MGLEVNDPQFFDQPADWGAWLGRWHDQRSEVWVGFHRKDSGLTSMSWSEAVDEALCWGWIDGICKKINPTSYVHRFTPRRPKSHWSLVNLAKVEQLTEQGRMQPSGLAACARRTPDRTGTASFEQTQPRQFNAVQRATFQTDGAAWRFFRQQAPSYQRMASHWVLTAKQAATRERRLAQLIHASAGAERLAALVGPARVKPAKKK
mgnify:CR=1 FL=1